VTTASEARRTFVEDERVDALRAFVLDRWKARATEMRLAQPVDLSSSCKFGALLVHKLYGGEIRGGWNHVHCRLLDGTILDLSRWAADVDAIRNAGIDPYVNDRAFIRSRDFKRSLENCSRRVEAWAEEWRRIEPIRLRKER
jgi:hypothetical protein